MRALRLSVLLSALAGCVAVPGRAPTAAPRDPTQPEFSAASLERSLHAETNRVQAGARVLRWNAWLAPTDATRRPAPPRPDSRAASRPGRIRIGVAENLARYGLYRSTRETTRGARVTRTTDWYRRDELVVQAGRTGRGRRRGMAREPGPPAQPARRPPRERGARRGRPRRRRIRHAVVLLTAGDARRRGGPRRNVRVTWPGVARARTGRPAPSRRRASRRNEWTRGPKRRHRT